MAKLVQGPATHRILRCGCGSKPTAYPAGVVGNVRCVSCGAVHRIRAGG